MTYRAVNSTQARSETHELKKWHTYTRPICTQVAGSTAPDLGATIISVTWIDINTDEEIFDNYKSRFVAREIKKDDRPDLFAAFPPLYALTAVISMCAIGSTGDTILVNGVIRAYFGAPARRQVFATPPEEDDATGTNIVG